MSRCDAVLAPQVFEQNTSLSSQIAALDVIDASQWNDLQAKSKAGIILDGLPLSGSFEAMKQALLTYKQTVSYNSTNDSTNAIFSRTIAADQVSAWSDCMVNANQGLKASFVPRFDESDSQTATLKVEFAPPPGLASVEISIVVEEGGVVRGDTGFSFPGAAGRDVIVDRIATSTFLKIIVTGKFPNGATQPVECAYYWEVPPLAPYPICGIFSGEGTLGNLVEIHFGMSGAACRVQTEAVAKARPDLNPNFRMGVADPNGQLTVQGVTILFNGPPINDEVLPHSARPPLTGRRVMTP